MTVVDPERDTLPGRRVAHLDGGETHVVACQVAERVVEDRVAQGSCCTEVIGRPGDVLLADRDLAVVGDQSQGGGQGELPVVDGGGAGGEVRVRTAGVRRRAVAEVGRGLGRRERCSGADRRPESSSCQRAMPLSVEPNASGWSCLLMLHPKTGRSALAVCWIVAARRRRFP